MFSWRRVDFDEDLLSKFSCSGMDTPAREKMSPRTRVETRLPRSGGGTCPCSRPASLLRERVKPGLSPKADPRRSEVKGSLFLDFIGYQAMLRECPRLPKGRDGAAVLDRTAGGRAGCKTHELLPSHRVLRNNLSFVQRWHARGLKGEAPI